MPETPAAGPALDAEIARVVFGHTKGIGYYGPPVDPTESWAHDKSTRYDTEDEARAAYAAYVDARVEAGHSQYGKATVEEMPFSLCYWQEGWGPRSICEYSTWIGSAWNVIEKLRELGKCVDVFCYPDPVGPTGGGWWVSVDEPCSSFHKFQATNIATAPLAIALAALRALGREEDGDAGDGESDHD